MKRLACFSSALFFISPVDSNATLAMWQTQVTGVGATPAATNFTTIPGGSPILFNVGNLSGDRSFEFIVNSPSGGASQALIGSQDVAAGKQGLKFDQYLNTGLYGMTNFGVADYNSTQPSDFGRDVHIVYTSDGATTSLYTDGIFRFSFPTGLLITGTNGLGAGDSAGVFFDVMAGSIYGFASYDTALSPAEILQHNNAFTAVPEPSSALLPAFALAGLLWRRRK